MKIEQGPQISLNKDEAHELANMMKAKWPLVSKTAEDYNRALILVEKIKQEAEEEPNVEKVFNNVARQALTNYHDFLDFVLGLCGSGDDLEERAITLNGLEDAAKKLKDLKAEAKKVAELENKGEVA
jgi:hypothetical protein